MNGPAGTLSAGRRAVLFVGLRIPTPDRDGGSARERRILEALLGLGCRVTFAYRGAREELPAGGPRSARPEDLEALGVEVIGPAAAGALEAHLRSAGRAYDLVLLSPYSVADRHLATVRELAPRARTAYLALDLGHVQHFRRARVTGKVPDLQRALEAKRVEMRLARDADVTLVCSPEEAGALGGLCPGAEIRLLAHAVDPRPSPPAFGERAGLLFLGSFLHLANVDAMERFVADVLPRVRAEVPEAGLRIAGSDPRGDVRRLAAPGVAPLGWVPDVGAEFDRARVFVAPLRYGAGIKIKVLDSLAAGLPTVLSPIAAEGLDVQHGESALVASSPEEFAASVVRLYRDEGLWRRVSCGGLDLVGRRFSRRVLEESLADLLPAREAGTAA